MLMVAALQAWGATDLVVSRVEPEAAGMSRQKLAAIPVRMKEFVDAGQTAGTVTIVARHGYLASFEAVGYQDLESKRPMQKDAMFRIASLTKPVVCAALMILVDEGRISVIDPIENFLPEYKNLKLNSCGVRNGYSCTNVPASRAINIEDLMTHTSGLPAAPEARGKAEPSTLADLVSQRGGTNLLFQPGTNWNYSNLGINIVGRIVELVSKQPLQEFMAKRIFEPLGMEDTYFFVPEEKRARMAALYSFKDGKAERMEAEWGAQQKPTLVVPAGGLVSTASDMLRFNEMMRNKGALNGHRILSSAAVKLMTTSHTGDLAVGWVPGAGHGYGYEVVRDVEGTFRYNSIGTFMKGGAYRTYEWIDPEKDLTGIFMMQVTTGLGDTNPELNSFMQLSAAAIER